MRTCTDNLFESKTELDYVFKILSLKQKELMLSLLEEEKELLFPFIDQNIWAEERYITLDSIILHINNA